MKKQRMQIIVLAVVLVVLIGGLLGLRAYNQAQEDAPREPEGEALCSMEADDILRMAYDYEGTRYEYEKVDGEWKYTSDPEQTMKQDKLTTIAAYFAQLTATDKIENVEDLSVYGLEEPARTFSFETDQESFTFFVGNLNDILGIYYICRPDENTVYIVDSKQITVFNVKAEDLIAEEEESDEAGNSGTEAEESGSES